MRAARCKAYGPPESVVVEDLPTPIPGPGQVRVDVRAAAVNFPDVLILQNRYQLKAAPPFTPGSELAGVVGERGPGVQELAVGDAVFGAIFVGAFAEQVVLPAGSLTRIPAGVDFPHAAAFGVVYNTAYLALTSVGELAAGETLVVLGAAGGVGLAAVALGKHLGARVIAAASSAAKLEVCRKCGADETIDYAREDLKERVKELTQGRGADVVLDPVGGSYSEPAFRATARGGRFVTVGFASGEIPRIPLNLVLLKGAQLRGFDFGPFAQHQPEQAARRRRELLGLLASGAIRPWVSAVVPLGRVGQALGDVAARRATGKVVIDLTA